jgi:hypothetical protein
MDKKNLKLKNNFTQLIGQVSKLYKEASNSTNEAYLLGKKEAFEEILNWFITSHNGELKYISANSFFSMIQEKLTKTKTALANEENAEEEIKQPVNFSEIKLADNRKRVFRSTYNAFNETNYEMDDESGNTSQINFPFSVSSLINSSGSLTSNSQINHLHTNSTNLSNLNANNSFQNNQNSIQNSVSESNSTFTHPHTSINSLGVSNNTQQNNILGSSNQINAFLPKKKKKN